MIKVSAIPDIVLVTRGRKIISQPRFSMTFVESSGALVEVADCICTSKFFPNRTINIKMTGSKEIRKVRTCTIIMFNDQETAI